MDKLLYVPNPLLRQKANKIQSVGIKEKEIAKKMMQIMLKAPGVGLAANQIGILKQIVTIFFVDQETKKETQYTFCLLYTSPSPRDQEASRMPSSA